MNFKILHLSDIHISSGEDNNHKILREHLVNYVRENISGIDAIVVTGDIVDRYDKNAFPTGKDFIDAILSAANLIKDKLVIVPGNHDLERSTVVEKILDESELMNPNFISANEKYIKPRMEAYVQFINSLKLGYDTDNQYGCGIRLIEKNGKKICFHLLNSAWTSKGNNDYGHLFIGREQLEHNRRKIEEQKNIDCVITIMHHPLSWLQREETELLKDYLIDESKIGSEIVLHGHIHDAAMEAAEYPSGKILLLISGIGYPKSNERSAGQPKISSCRFSVYDLDISQKSADCFFLISTESGTFVPDTRLYKGSQDGHYTMYWNTERKPVDQIRDKYINLDPIPATKCWSGREEELKSLSRENVNVIAILGVGGQGKTALAAEFMRRDANGKEEFEQRVWVDCRELQDTMHARLLRILELLTNGKESQLLYKDEQLKDTIRRFLRYLQEHKIVVVFDNVDAYVTFDTDELIGELKDITDGVLTHQNNSLIILTCRTSIYDARANFHPIHLDGLKEPEGIAYFEKREISLKDPEDLEACKKIIRITKGHPWWIGLICGQMIANRINPKDYLEQNSDGLSSMRNSQLECYFSAIWNKLGDNNKGKIRQNIIRFLVESARPLTTLELSQLLNENHNQTLKAVNHLYRISLLIEHDSEDCSVKSYQVHPLVREYIHKIYNPEIQKSFVLQLLELLIGKKLYDNIFGKEDKTQKYIECNTRDIIDSIETCLNSRNESEALDLIIYSYNMLCDNGCLAEYLELSGRILDEINWGKEEIAQMRKRSDFLYHYLDVLSIQEHKADKVLYYLSLYEKNCEKNTVAYSGYLATKADVMWCMGHFKEAYSAIKEYDDMNSTNIELRKPTDTENLKGMILRECGRIDEALEIFEASSDSVARTGNIARCYQKQGNYAQAMENLRECLKKLKGKGDLNDNINRGYAYFWIAELYCQQAQYHEANVFMTICQEIWKEYAPGLLAKTENLLKKLEGRSIEMEPNQREEMVREFMDGR